jgi:hypothetical protein
MIGIHPRDLSRSSDKNITASLGQKRSVAYGERSDGSDTGKAASRIYTVIGPRLCRAIDASRFGPALPSLETLAQTDLIVSRDNAQFSHLTTCTQYTEDDR